MIFFKSKEIQNTLFLLGDKGITIILSSISFVIMGKYLGATKFGLISYAISFVAIFSPLAEWAYTTIVTKFIAQKYAVIDMIKKSLMLRLGGFLFVLVIISITTLFLEIGEDMITCIRILSFALLLDIVLILRSYFDATLQSRYFSYSQTTSTIIGSGIRIILALVYPSIVFICMSYFVEKLVKSLIILGFFISKSKDFKLGIEEISSKNIFLDSIPLILTNSFIIINFKIDQLIIEYFMGLQAVGQYAVVSKISEIWYLIPTTLFISYFPAIARSEREGKDSILAVKKVTRALLLISITIALILTFTGETLIQFLFGEEYVNLGKVLSIHIWAGVFYFIGHPISKILIAKNLIWINFFGKMITIVVNIALNFFFIPIFGLSGAAISTLVSYSIGYFFFYLIHPKVKLHILFFRNKA